jgi:iron complex transport system substrate-binding protein
MRSPSSLHLFIILIFFFNITVIAQDKFIKDSLGTKFELRNPPQRIVSLSPAITEILYFIGAGDRVVGVTRYCDFPDDARKKEKIGGIIDIDMEKILRIQPDIVFATRGNPIEIIKRMKSFGIKVFAIDTGERIEEIFEAMRKISLVTGDFQKCERRISGLESRVRRVQKKAEGAKVKPRVFLKLGSEGLWTAGRKTFINDLILKSGCKNVADFKEGWFEMNIETLISKNPDIIIILSSNIEDFESTKKFLLSLPGFSALNSVRNKMIFPLNVDFVERPGPRIVDALEEIYKICHGRDGLSILHQGL